MTENNSKLIEEISKIRKIQKTNILELKLKLIGKKQMHSWQSDAGCFKPVKNVNSIPLELLKGIDQNIDILLENTIKFSKSLPANNALYGAHEAWEKVHLLKEYDGKLCKTSKNKLILIEIYREDIRDLKPEPHHQTQKKLNLLYSVMIYHLITMTQPINHSKQPLRAA